MSDNNSNNKSTISITNSDDSNNNDISNVNSKSDNKINNLSNTIEPETDINNKLNTLMLKIKETENELLLFKERKDSNNKNAFKATINDFIIKNIKENENHKEESMTEIKEAYTDSVEKRVDKYINKIKHLKSTIKELKLSIEYKNKIINKALTEKSNYKKLIEFKDKQISKLTEELEISNRERATLKELLNNDIKNKEANNKKYNNYNKEYVNNYDKFWDSQLINKDDRELKSSSNLKLVQRYKLPNLWINDAFTSNSMNIAKKNINKNNKK